MALNLYVKPLLNCDRIIIVFNFRQFLLREGKLIIMRHGTEVKSTVHASLQITSHSKPAEKIDPIRFLASNKTVAVRLLGLAKSTENIIEKSFPLKWCRTDWRAPLHFEPCSS